MTATSDGPTEVCETDKWSVLLDRHDDPTLQLQNPAITAPIPGLINIAQVDNMARAVRERRELDAKEAAQLREANQQMWAKLPENYQWLKQWEYV